MVRPSHSRPHLTCSTNWQAFVCLCGALRAEWSQKESARPEFQHTKRPLVKMWSMCEEETTLRPFLFEPSSRELTTVSQTLHWSRSQDSRKPRNSTASRSADARLDPPVIVDPGYTPTVPEQSINSTLAIDDSRSRLSRALDVLPHFGTILITSRLSQGACSNTFAPASSYTSGGKAALPVKINV